MAKRPFLSRAYWAIAATMMAAGFAGLFSHTLTFKIPFISTAIIPFLDRYKVWGETLRGPAVIVGGEQWFFLIMAAITLMLGIVVAAINSLFKK